MDEIGAVLLTLAAGVVWLLVNLMEWITKAYVAAALALLVRLPMKGVLLAGTVAFVVSKVLA